MTGTKSAVQSLGVLGPLLGILVMMINRFWFKGDVLAESDISELVDLGAGLFTAATGIYGRIRATTKIVSVLPVSTP
jgi:hypothetical protein